MIFNRIISLKVEVLNLKLKVTSIIWNMYINVKSNGLLVSLNFTISKILNSNIFNFIIKFIYKFVFNKKTIIFIIIYILFTTLDFNYELFTSFAQEVDSAQKRMESFDRFYADEVNRDPNYHMRPKNWPWWKLLLVYVLGVFFLMVLSPPVDEDGELIFEWMSPLVENNNQF